MVSPERPACRVPMTVITWHSYRGALVNGNLKKTSCTCPHGLKQGGKGACHRPSQVTCDHKDTDSMLTFMQVLRSSGDLQMAEGNLAAVQLALMDLLSRGSAFAGLHHHVSHDIHPGLWSIHLTPLYELLPYKVQHWAGAIHHEADFSKKHIAKTHIATLCHKAALASGQKSSMHDYCTGCRQVRPKAGACERAHCGEYASCGKVLARPQCPLPVLHEQQQLRAGVQHTVPPSIWGAGPRCVSAEAPGTCFHLL